MFGIKSVDTILSAWTKTIKQLKQNIVQRTEAIAKHVENIAYEEEQKLVHSSEISKAKAALEKLKTIF